jgi:hypothetical protein
MEGISVNLARLGTAVKSLGIIREKKKNTGWQFYYVLVDYVIGCLTL